MAHSVMADTIKIAYLLDPFYQVQDNNGLTVAGAQIFVYQAGTTNPANTFKNFNGALNTWPILTDTLGNATVLADISKTYDVLIKDQNGNLLMSKQNMVPGGAGEGGGSITPVEPIDQQHWIGLNGSSTAVSADIVGTILHLPDASDEYQAFIESNRNDHIILSDGLYLVHAVIDIKQDSDALENTIENLTVMTGVADPEDVIFERDEAGHDASDNVHSLKLSFIRHADALGGTNELFFRIISAVNLTSAAIRRLSIVKLQTSGYGSDPQPIPSDVLRESDLDLDTSGNIIGIDEHPIAGGGTTYQAGQYIDITNNTISVSGINPESYLTSGDLDGYATEQWVLDKNYITSADVPPIPEDVVTSGELANVSADIVNQIPSLDGYATEQYVQDYTSGFITSADLPDVSDMATKTWVEEQGYITIEDIPEDLVTSGELANVSGDIVNQIPSLDGYATETWVNEQTRDFITSADVPTYTAGEGIDIISGEVSVKAGNGLSIGNTTKYVHISSLSTSNVWAVYDMSTQTNTYWINDICTLTSDLLSSIENGGLNITLSIPFSISTTYQAFAAIVKWTTESGQAPSIDKRLVLGSELNHELSIGTNIVFDGNSVNSTHSNCTFQDIRGSLNPDILQRVWHIGIIIVTSNIFGNNYSSAGHSFGSTPPVTPVTTATYGSDVIITDALNVDLPVPTTTGHSQGDVLSIGSSGIQWSTPQSIGFEAFDEAVMVSALPPTTDPRTLYLIPEA